MSTAREITLAECKAATKAADAKRLVGRAVKAWQARDKADQSATVSAAYATYAADVTGHLRDVGQGVYAAMYGWRDSHVTLMKTAGYAAVHGLARPGSEVWSHLFHRGGAGYSDVRKAIHAEGATPASVEKALRTRIAPDGKRLSATARPDDGSKAGSKGAGKDVDAARSEEIVVSLVPVQRVELAVKMLAKAAGDLTPEQWAHTRGRLADIMRKEDTLRAEKAATAGKPAAKASKAAAKAVAKATPRKAASTSRPAARAARTPVAQAS